MKTVAITGATGFLGRALSRELVRRGNRVRALVRRDSDREWARSLSVEFCESDKMTKAWEQVEGADHLVHLAASYGREGVTRTELLETNVGLTVGALEASARFGIERVLVAGSALPPDVSDYALSKHQAAEWTERSVDVPATVMKLHNFYGPGDSAQSFSSRLVRTCKFGGVMDLTEGRQQRDFIFIDDVVSAIVALLGAPELPRSIDVGSGKASSIRAFAQRACALGGDRAELRFGAVPTRPAEPARLVADTSVLLELGWRAEYDLDRGLRTYLGAIS